VRVITTILTLLLLLPRGGEGQVQPSGGGGEVIDRIVAIAGDSAILYSQVQEHLFRLESRGIAIPTDPVQLSTFQRDALDDLIAQNLILQAAVRDTLVVVQEDRIEQTFQDAWADQVARFGTEAALREAIEGSGQSVQQYRAEQREEIRRSLYIERYVQLQRQTTRPPPVEEREIRAFFERELPNLGARPATMEFAQVVLVPQASEAALSVARDEAERILALLRGGDDFGEMARRYSQDPGSAPRGGELGWVRQGMMVQEFEDVAFRLGRGQTSGVVTSVYGAHIIRVERIRGPERLVSHILIAAEPSAPDVERARTRAIEIREAIATGSPISTFIGEGEQTLIPNELTLAMDQVGSLPGGYPLALRAAQAGQVIGPVEFPAMPTRPGFAVVQIREVRESGAYTYEDVRQEIRSILENERFETRLIERLMAEAFIDVRW